MPNRPGSPGPTGPTDAPSAPGARAPIRRRRFATLTSRLVLTTVLLTATVALAVGTATTLALQANLTAALDDEVHSLIKRSGPEGEDAPTPPERPGDAGTDTCSERFIGGNQGPGTLFARLGDDNSESRGAVLTETYCGEDALSSSDLDQLAEIASDGDIHVVDLEGLGEYRVIATETDNGVIVAGLPTAEVDDATSSLIVDALVIGLVAVLVAGSAAALVVRRQLRPLRVLAATAHDVAALPLAQGEVDLAGRVPAHLIDEHTEVGQVGAALDTLLTHVDDAITARHRSEQQVRQFVADASHELRTPLATIAGYAELARRRPGDADAARTALGKVEDESGRMRRLVEDLLTLARLDAGRRLAHETVDVTRLLLETVTDARVLAPDHHWHLDLPDEALELSGDGHALHQVVTNLLTNARKYTPGGTTVSVGARSVGDRVEITVHDDGPGFPAAIAASAFDRFVRGDAARTRTPSTASTPEAGGSGLGLALVRAITEAHGGEVALESRPGSTSVRVTVPESLPGSQPGSQPPDA